MGILSLDSIHPNVIEAYLLQALENGFPAMFESLREHPIPLSVLSQFMPRQYERVISGGLENTLSALVLDKIRYVLRRYSLECGWRTNT